MLSASDVHKALYALQAMNLNFQVQGQADFWTPVLNEALPDLTADDLKKAVNRLAATRGTEMRGGRITPADIIGAAQGVSAEQKRERLARLEAAKREHGDFTAHPEITDPTEFVTFKQTVTAAFSEGASVERAQAAGWAAIGRDQPPPEITSAYEVPTHIGKEME